MTEFRSKNFANPDQTIRFPKLTAELVEIGELTVGYIVTEPGWRGSVDLRPLVGGEWCQARHVGVVLPGYVAPCGCETDEGSSSARETCSISRLVMTAGPLETSPASRSSGPGCTPLPGSARAFGAEPW